MELKKLIFVNDPKFYGDSMLSLHIMPELEPLDALELLDKFTDEWWLDEMYKAMGNLIINLDYYEL